MFTCLPILRVHTWGGLGSQLFAVALASDLRNTSANRKVVIVLHSGGVTRRLPEITQLYPEFNYEFVDDFKKSKGEMVAVGFNTRNLVRRSASKLLRVLQIISSANDDSEFTQLKPWTIALRGHYSYRTISLDFLKDFYSRIMGDDDESEFAQNRCSLHFRLGDLLILTEKKPLIPSRVAGELNRICMSRGLDRIDLYSDSPEVALESLTGLLSRKIEAHSLTTIDVMLQSTLSDYFVGTSSKISFWISAIRSQVLNIDSSLPSENIREIKNMIGINSNHVSFY